MYICAWQAPELQPRGVDLLEDHARRREREPCAAVLLRDERGEPAVLGQRARRTPPGSGRARARASTRPGSARRARARPRGSRPAPPAARSPGQPRVPLEQPPRDDQLLDLVRALADEEQRRVAVVALGPELERVAVAAVDAHAVERVLLRCLGREVLRHPGLEVGALAGALRCAAWSDEQPGGLRARRHLREHQLHGLVAARSACRTPPARCA